jgi:preprotein translocase subunit SecA
LTSILPFAFQLHYEVPIMNRSDCVLPSQNSVAPFAFKRPSTISKLKNIFSRAAGKPIETGLVEYWEMVRRLKAMDLTDKTAAQLAERMGQIACRFRAGCTEKSIHSSADLDCPTFNNDAAAGYREGARSFGGVKNVGLEIASSEIEMETFALVREASRRTLGLDPFDAQLIAGMAMARGCIAELPTGEGKTLAAVFTACLGALSGRGVHILTFNDYLARRDAVWMGPVYRALGLRVGCVQEGMPWSEKKAAYACDVTYAAAKEAGFDFLRDQIAYGLDERVHRPFSVALVDEADSILIDEARIPLVISGAEDKASWDVTRLASVVGGLIPEKDFETDDEHRNIFLTDLGIERVESMLGCGNLYGADNQFLLQAVYCALHARALLRRDVDYIVRGDRIEIVDEYTGRVVEKRHWPDGLQAAVEAKEGLARRTQGRILGSITLQHFFQLYPAIGGMTATAQSAADEFYEFYGMTVAVIPPHRPSIRVDYPDRVFTHRDAKRQAIVREIVEVHALGRPILVGTASVKESEELARDLRPAGIKCVVLNAKNDELEASVIAKAGLLGAITISTNMAGRGVDIKLGGNDESQRAAVAAMGGLYVIGTNRHESLRIDRQLRGRAGRQGDPGATRFFISIEDDMFERYGLSKMLMKRYRLKLQEAPLADGSIQRKIAHAQRVIEGQNFDIRRFLYKFSSLVDLQRQVIQSRREGILLNPGLVSSKQRWDSSPRLEETAEGASILSVRDPVLYEDSLRRLGPDKMAEIERRATLFHLDHVWSDHLAWIQDTRDSINLVNLGGREPIAEFTKWATEEFLDLQNRIDDSVASEMAAIVRKEGPIDLDLERLKGPSSTWTYLINENQFGSGFEMIKTKNIGYAIFMSPLLIMMLLLTRRSRRKQNHSMVG